MLMRDLSGRMINVPENGYAQFGLGRYHPYGSYHSGYFSGLSGVNTFGNQGVQRIVYDGLGNPLGILPFIPLIAKAATTLLPTLLPKVLPMLTGGGAGSAAGAIPQIASKILPMLTGGASSPAESLQPQAAAPITVMQTPATPTNGSMPATNMPPPPADSMIVPMNVQTPQGERIIRVRVRRRRRARGPVTMPYTRQTYFPALPVPIAPAVESRNLQGWAGYGRW
jgi:hypothetical protein